MKNVIISRVPLFSLLILLSLFHIEFIYSSISVSKIDKNLPSPLSEILLSFQKNTFLKNETIEKEWILELQKLNAQMVLVERKKLNTLIQNTLLKEILDFYYQKNLHKQDLVFNPLAISQINKKYNLGKKIFSPFSTWLIDSVQEELWDTSSRYQQTNRMESNRKKMILSFQKYFLEKSVDEIESDSWELVQKLIKGLRSSFQVYQKLSAPLTKSSSKKDQDYFKVSEIKDSDSSMPNDLTKKERAKKILKDLSL